MTKSILLTRPQPASERWAALLAERGFGTIIEPLLFIEPTFLSRPEGVFQAVLITSANAPDMLDAMKDHLVDLFPLPCFCVGMQTAEAARRLGFKDVRSTSSDSLAIAQLVVSELTNTQGPLLHIASDVVDIKARDLLERSGFSIEQWAVYHARAATDLSPQLCKLFETSDISAIPVFSPRSAHILVSLLEKKRLSQSCHSIVAIGLSQAVADVLQRVPWRKLTVATTPSEESVLASLQSELSMTEVITKATPDIPLKVDSSHRKGSPFVRIVLSLILMGTIAALLTRYEVSKREAVTVEVPSHILALEKRIDALETQVTAMTEIAQATPQTSSDNSELQAQIKSLDTRLTQIENLGAQNHDADRKWASTLLAFLDLRDATRSGRTFSHELDAMRVAGADEPAISEAVAKLEPLSAEGVPSFQELRIDLEAQEQLIAVPEASENAPTLLGRLRFLFAPLISVHPLHDPRFDALAKALDDGDGSLAVQKFQDLPQKTKDQLGAWQDNLVRRIMIDDVIHKLSIDLTSFPKGAP